LLLDRVARRDAIFEVFIDLGFNPGVRVVANLYGGGKFAISDEAMDVLTREFDATATQIFAAQEHDHDEPRALSCSRSLSGTFLRDC
jgi:hypothetical protein